MMQFRSWWTAFVVMVLAFASSGLEPQLGASLALGFVLGGFVAAVFIASAGVRRVGFRLPFMVGVPEVILAVGLFLSVALSMVGIRGGWLPLAMGAAVLVAPAAVFALWVTYPRRQAGDHGDHETRNTAT